MIKHTDCSLIICELQQFKTHCKIYLKINANWQIKCSFSHHAILVKEFDILFVDNFVCVIHVKQSFMCSCVKFLDKTGMANKVSYAQPEIEQLPFLTSLRFSVHLPENRKINLTFATVSKVSDSVSALISMKDILF